MTATWACALIALALAPQAALGMSSPSKLMVGTHGQGSRFIPLQVLRKDDSLPRLLPVAGMLPHCTEEDIMRPVSPSEPAPGRWKYYKLTGAEAPFGFVCMSVPETFLTAESPVVLVAMASDLGIPLTDGKNDEVLVLVDRKDPACSDPEAFNNRKFYVFGEPDGRVGIRWQEEPCLAGERILGKVLYVNVPYIEPKNKPNTGFAETSDEFEF